jgi:glycosyltransferase involved in cell wall biosynthesis
MQLIYFAPLAWSSFAQRPHMFVRWFHEKYQCPVIWVNPYPTRFPELNDFKRIAKNLDACDTDIPEWLRILSPKSLPIEPLPASSFVNGLLWQSLLKNLIQFAAAQPTLLAIGKPSALALTAIEKLPNCISFYDAMDDYPQFYRGISRAVFSKREQVLVKQAKLMAVSSTNLLEKWQVVRTDVQLIRNGLMPDLFLPVEPVGESNSSLVFGYLGTIAQWFDWDWIIRLAELFPESIVRLVGPCYTPLPEILPNNIEILPVCDHLSAILAMKQFDVGLIPFKQTQLTASVDPIKFYEYRALGIPVVASAFGEMLTHKELSGVFLSYSQDDIARTLTAALKHQDTVPLRIDFIANNTWQRRFDQLVLA